MFKRLLLPSLLFAFAHTASAAPLTLTFGGGGWQNPVAPPSVCVDIDNRVDPGVGGDVDSVRWGQGRMNEPGELDVVLPAHAGYTVGGDACWDVLNTTFSDLGYLAPVSGYDFDPFEDATLSGGLVNLGTFFHLNQTINGLVGLDTIEYAYTLNGPGSPLNFTISFEHFESPESPENNPDTVQIATPNLSALLQVGSDQYLFKLLGFGLTGNDALLNYGLVSSEGTSEHAYLWASVTPVPEPATLTMLGTGLLGLGAAARRRMRKARS